LVTCSWMLEFRCRLAVVCVLAGRVIGARGGPAGPAHLFGTTYISARADLAPLKARKWSTNTGCGSGVGVLRGGGKVAVVGGRSGSFSPRAGYEGRQGAMRDSGMRSAKGSQTVFSMVDILGLATALRAAIIIIKIVFVFVFGIVAMRQPWLCGKISWQPRGPRASQPSREQL
jgi:hypothetical protein